MTALFSPDQRPVEADAADSGSAEWYCLRAQPKHEHIAAAHLRRSLGLEAFCPRIRFQRSTRRGLVWFVEGLFPGYFFARFALGQQRAQVLYTPGVMQIVHFGDHFPHIEPTAIHDLRQFIGDEECKVVPHHIGAGDEVDVVDGPLRGQTGMVIAVMPARDRVKVLLEFLGGTQIVELGLTAVFRPPPPALPASP
jgi:transcriptional antiterminator RfaH